MQLRQLANYSIHRLQNPVEGGQKLDHEGEKGLGHGRFNLSISRVNKCSRQTWKRRTAIRNEFQTCLLQ